MKKIAALIILSALFSCSKSIKKEFTLNKTPISSHPYWGKINKSSIDRFGDTIKIPVELDFSIFIDDIAELETNKSDFVSKLKLRLWSSYEDYTLLKSEDTIILSPISLVEFDYRITENLYHTPWEWDGYYQPIKKYRYVKEIENKFYHKWNLRKYPFDKQKIRFTFTSKFDTTYVRIKNSKKFNSYANEYLANLKDGFVIDTIIFKEEFIKSEIIEPFDKGIYNYDGGIERNEVRSRGVFEVILSRDGSWVFVKLFLGSFLSLLLSWFVFLIPMSEFDAKSNLSVGAIFGAVGNKYFVDSAVSSQILTAADLINNIIITLVILNVLIMILQKNKKRKTKYLKDEKSALKLSIIIFLVSMFLTIIFIT